MIRFLIKEKVLCMEDLDDIWAAQIGQHEAIVKNVHDLLAKLAWYEFVFKSLQNSYEILQFIILLGHINTNIFMNFSM